MLWSQYKLATKRRSEFPRKQITGIPNFANRNSDFLSFQTLEFQKKRPESPESKTELELCFRWGSQKLEQKIGITNQAGEAAIATWMQHKGNSNSGGKGGCDGGGKR
jgi:hypothetical protein